MPLLPEKKADVAVQVDSLGEAGVEQRPVPTHRQVVDVADRVAPAEVTGNHQLPGHSTLLEPFTEGFGRHGFWVDDQSTGFEGVGDLLSV